MGIYEVVVLQMNSSHFTGIWNRKYHSSHILVILPVNEKTCKMELESLRDIMYGSYLENPL